MRHVPITELQDRAKEIFAAAESGEDVVFTRDGRDVFRLVAIEDDRVAHQRAVVDAAYALGQEMKAKYGPTTADDIAEWRRDGRR